uniref:Uncharacterized protein n=1 Tax=Anguilla anguilla TaxID=7936 RepID=A0A0E9TUP2_ANGAN
MYYRTCFRSEIDL